MDFGIEFIHKVTGQPKPFQKLKRTFNGFGNRVSPQSNWTTKTRVSTNSHVKNIITKLVTCNRK